MTSQNEMTFEELSNKRLTNSSLNLSLNKNKHEVHRMDLDL